jgi:hypothetical protein
MTGARRLPGAAVGLALAAAIAALIAPVTLAQTARFSRPADDVETGTDQFVSIKTGGLQVGGGMRFLF